MVEVQWKTGALQTPQFVLPSRCCSLQELGKLLWCLFASSGKVCNTKLLFGKEAWITMYRVLSKLQRCSSEQHKKQSGQFVVLFLSGHLALASLKYTPQHCSLVEKKTSIPRRGSQCPQRSPFIPLLSCPNLLELWSFLKWSFKSPCRASDVL